MIHTNNPTNEKAHGCDPVSLETDTTNDLNFATGQRPRKEIATQLAELALAGHTVHKLQCGDFLVCKFGHSFYAQDFDALRAFARRLGVNK